MARQTTPAVASHLTRSTMYFAFVIAMLLLRAGVATAQSENYVLVSNPPSLTFSTQQGASAAAQSINIWDTSPDLVPFSVSTDQPWLQASPANATTAAHVAVSVATGSLAAGSYSGNVIITAPTLANSPMFVPVSLTVSAATAAQTSFVLVSNPAALSFSSSAGTAVPAAQSINIWDTSPDHVPFSVSTDQPWLQASPATATTAAHIAVSVAPGSLAAGSYSGNVIITAPTLANSPLLVPVALSVTGGSSLSITTTSLPIGQVDALYTAVFAAAGGTPPLRWTIGGLPAGLSLSLSLGNTATIAGTATQAGTSNVVAAVTDLFGASAQASLSLTISAATKTDYLLVGNPASLAFSWQTSTSAPAAQSINVADTSPDHVPFSVSTDQPWLQANPASASTAALVSVSIVPGNLVPGTYVGNIILTAPTLANSPLLVPVTVTVTPTGSAKSVFLSWTASTSTTSGYNAYRSTVSGGPYTKVNASLVLTTTFTDGNVQSGQTYYYVTTAVDNDGVESGFSNEAQVTIP